MNVTSVTKAMAGLNLPKEELEALVLFLLSIV
jgi:hypothetical protein